MNILCIYFSLSANVFLLHITDNPHTHLLYELLHTLDNMLVELK